MLLCICGSEIIEPADGTKPKCLNQPHLVCEECRKVYPKGTIGRCAQELQTEKFLNMDYEEQLQHMLDHTMYETCNGELVEKK